MQTAAPIGPEGENCLAKDQDPGRAHSIHSEAGVTRECYLDSRDMPKDAILRGPLAAHRNRRCTSQGARKRI